MTVLEDDGSTLKARLTSVHVGFCGIVTSAVSNYLFVPLLRQSFPFRKKWNGPPVFRRVTAHKWKQLGLVFVKVWMEIIMDFCLISLAVFRLLESICIKLANETREGDASKVVAAGQGVGVGRQDLLLQELLVNFDTFAFAVPNNGCDLWLIQQMPQFRWEDVREDQMWPFAGLHCISSGKDQIKRCLNIVVCLTSGRFFFRWSSCFFLLSETFMLKIIQTSQPQITKSLMSVKPWIIDGQWQGFYPMVECSVQFIIRGAFLILSFLRQKSEFFKCVKKCRCN